MRSFKPVLYLAALSGMFLGIGYLYGGSSGMTIAFVLALVMNVSYWFSDKVVLAMHRAKPVDRAQLPELYAMTEELSHSAQLPMPKLYIYEDPQPNAFATGRDYTHGVVAVSTGILQLLDQRELRGVIAHELAHIKNRDMLIASMAAILASAISWIGELTFGLGSLFMPRGEDDEGGANPLLGLVFIIITPIIAMLVQMALSRSREFVADETGAKIAGDASGLRSALLKLYHRHAQSQDRPSSLATAHLYISNPLRGGGLLKMLSTHPPVEERVKRLEQLRLG